MTEKSAPTEATEHTEAAEHTEATERTEATAHTEASRVPEAEPATSAVPFDPFAEDDNDDGSEDGNGDSDDGYSSNEDNIASLLQDLQKIRDEKAQKQRAERQEDTSTRARRQALSTFRKRRRAQRTARAVADRMVRLPFVVPTDPQEALIDPHEAIEKKKIPAPQLNPGDIVAQQYEILGVIAHGGIDRKSVV